MVKATETPLCIFLPGFQSCNLKRHCLKLVRTSTTTTTATGFANISGNFLAKWEPRSPVFMPVLVAKTSSALSKHYLKSLRFEKLSEVRSSIGLQNMSQIIELHGFSKGKPNSGL